MIFFSILFFSQVNFPFLVADTRLYTLPCRSVGRSVRPSHFWIPSGIRITARGHAAQKLAISAGWSVIPFEILLNCERFLFCIIAPAHPFATRGCIRPWFCRSPESSVMSCPDLIIPTHDFLHRTESVCIILDPTFYCQFFSFFEIPNRVSFYVLFQFSLIVIIGIFPTSNLS